MVRSNLFAFGACGSFRRSETQHGADFVERKSKFPSTPYESEYAKVRFPMNAPPLAVRGGAGSILIRS